MARIEAGQQGDMGREREWLARAVRAPRDRAWIADGYVSDRWLPVSPVTGAVDAFEWKAPVDAIGRGDDTLLIEDRAGAGDGPTRSRLAPFALPRAEPARIEKREACRGRRVAPRRSSAPRIAADETPGAGRARSTAEQTAQARHLRAARPPDDPGVAQTEIEEPPEFALRARKPR